MDMDLCALCSALELIKYVLETERKGISPKSMPKNVFDDKLKLKYVLDEILK